MKDVVFAIDTLLVAFALMQLRPDLFRGY